MAATMTDRNLADQARRHIRVFVRVICGVPLWSHQRAAALAKAVFTCILACRRQLYSRDRLNGIVGQRRDLLRRTIENA